MDDVFQHIEVSHHNEEGQQGEYDEILHGLGIGAAVVVFVIFLVLAENEGFVGVAEGLGYHGHDHGYLDTGAVDAELHLAFVAGHKVAEDEFVGRLVEDAGNAEHQYGPGVAPHGTHQLAVEDPSEAGQLFPQQGYRDEGAEEVYGEDVAHADFKTVHQSRQQEEEHQVEHDVEGDVEQFEGGKLERALLVAQVGKGNAQESIDGHAEGHHLHILRVPAIVEKSGDGI